MFAATGTISAVRKRFDSFGSVWLGGICNPSGAPWGDLTRYFAGSLAYLLRGVITNERSRIPSAELYVSAALFAAAVCDGLFGWGWSILSALILALGAGMHFALPAFSGAFTCHGPCTWAKSWQPWQHTER